jgi:hypothetical protein
MDESSRQLLLCGWFHYASNNRVGPDSGEEKINAVNPGNQVSLPQLRHQTLSLTGLPGGAKTI